jgi:threonine dehydrogenase-like Zn-dependent dehydrogenase
VEEVGPQVRNFNPGDRVVIPSTIGCGRCAYCRAGYFAQCDVANPNGPDGDIFPTAWFGARLAEVEPGDVVLVLGAGPVGQLAALSARIQGAGRVLIVDGNADRLETARLQNAETIDFNAEDPVAAVKDLTGGIGADRVIDAVGVDAQRPIGGPAAQQLDDEEARNFTAERDQLAPETNVQGSSWMPGDAPSQALRWAVAMVAKAGTIGIVGVYPPTYEAFPLGAAMNANLTIQAGNCNHRKYVPGLLSRIAAGTADPTTIITQQEPMPSVMDAYEAFDRREPGWTKVVLELAG